MFRIDAHAHIAADHTESLAFLRSLDTAILNVCVAKAPAEEDDGGRALFSSIARAHPDRLAWCTTFSPFGLEKPTAVEAILDQLSRDFSDGAVACKLWKNVGMEVLRADGRPLLPDDPLLDPVYQWLEHEGHPLLIHAADPATAWLPPAKHGNPPSAYLRRHPHWHLHDQPGMPSRAVILAARDRLLEHRPALTVIGAHLGSMEDDLPRLAELLRRYPRFAVDLSARTVALLRQDPGLVRDFLLEFSDRILWGSDAVQRTPHSQLSPHERRNQLERYAIGYPASEAFYGGTGTVQYGPYRAEGLGLPADALRRLFRDNAWAWYPRLRAWQAHERAEP